MAWLNTVDNTSNFDQVAGSRQVGTGGGETLWLGQYNNGFWNAFLNTDSASGSAQSPSKAEINKDTHVASTWSAASGTPRLWVNGVLVTSTAVAGTQVAATTREFLIGATNNGGGLAPGSFWDGRIEDMRIYGREMGAAEIETIYATRGYDGIVRSLLARYPLTDTPDGTTVATVAEVSGTAGAQVTALTGGTGSSFVPTRARSRRIGTLTR